MKIDTPRPSRKNYHPSSLQKGHAFEDYIITLFDESNFKLLYWNNDNKVASNGVFPQSNSLPDLEFAFLGKRKHRFAVECKWRKGFAEGKITWAQDHQVGIYEQYEKENRIPVFIAIGVGGKPYDPEKLFVTPLCNISMYTEVFESQLVPYKRKPSSKFFYDTKQLKLF